MKNAQFETDIRVIPSLFHKLNLIEVDGEIIISGELDVIDSTGRLWDTYKVEIRGSANYPYSFPKLFETGSAFPHIADWHVYEQDGSCCVDVQPNELILCKNGLRVTEYLNRFVIPYFANQTYRTREGYYLYGEYSHGIFGRIEFYQGKLKAKNPKELIAMFGLITQNYSPPRTTYCPFCRNLKFRNCHREVFRELQKIKEVIFFDAVTQLIPFLKTHPNYKLPRI